MMTTTILDYLLPEVEVDEYIFALLDIKLESNAKAGLMIYDNKKEVTLILKGRLNDTDLAIIRCSKYIVDYEEGTDYNYHFINLNVDEVMYQRLCRLYRQCVI